MHLRSDFIEKLRTEERSVALPVREGNERKDCFEAGIAVCGNGESAREAIIKAYISLYMREKMMSGKAYVVYLFGKGEIPSRKISKVHISLHYCAKRDKR